MFPKSHRSRDQKAKPKAFETRCGAGGEKDRRQELRTPDTQIHDGEINYQSDAYEQASRGQEHEG